MEAIVERDARRERSANLRAATVTAAVYNTLRSKDSDKFWQASDFLQEPKKPMSIEEATAAMRGWASIHNRSIGAA